jgi:methylated-DNA-protein-cysteine methyltransferase related protein
VEDLTPFETAVAEVLRSLQEGEVVSYGDVAVEAGYSPRASRAVGAFLSRRGDEYPWWRVVTVDGRLVPGHEVEHARRLRKEGVDTMVGKGGNRVRRAMLSAPDPLVPEDL